MSGSGGRSQAIRLPVSATQGAAIETQEPGIAGANREPAHAEGKCPTGIMGLANAGAGHAWNAQVTALRGRAGLQTGSLQFEASSRQ